MHTKLYARKVGGSSREKSKVTTGPFQLQPAGAGHVGRDCLWLWRRGERGDCWEKKSAPSLSDLVRTSAKTEATFCKPAPWPTILNGTVRFFLADTWTWCTCRSSLSRAQLAKALFSQLEDTRYRCMSDSCQGQGWACWAAAATFNLKSNIFPGGQIGTNICWRTVQSWLIPGDWRVSK